MEVHWNPWAAAWTLEGLVGIGLAIVIFRAGPGRLANRSLSAFLLCLGIGLLNPDAYVNDPSFEVAWQSAYLVALGVMLATYPLFLTTLDSPLTAELRGPLARGTLASLVVILPIFFVGFRHKILGPIELGTLGWSYIMAPGEWTPFIFAALALLTFFALLVSVTAFFRAPKGSVARQRAKAYSIAFAFFDLYVGLLNVIFTLAEQALLGTIDGSKWPVGFQIFQTLLGITVYAFFFGLMAYGILKTQLFDIDIKLKWTVRQGSVAAIFLAVFFIATSIAQNALGQQFGLVGGGVAAGLLAFGLAPVQKIADRFANRAMPHVHSSSAEYLTFKKLQIYRAAIEAALQDGIVTDKERAVIECLRVELDVKPDDARSVEQDVRRIFEARLPVAVT